MKLSETGVCNRKATIGKFYFDIFITESLVCVEKASQRVANSFTQNPM